MYTAAPTKLSPEEIMDRLSRISRRRDCGVSTRPDFPQGKSKWFVFMRNVTVGHVTSGALSTFMTNGLTPQEAISDAWNQILRISQNSDLALMRYNCADNVYIPGEEPQVWVRWDVKQDDWVDVPVPSIPAEKLRTYKDQVWRDKT